MAEKDFKIVAQRGDDFLCTEATEEELKGLDARAVIVSPMATGNQPKKFPATGFQKILKWGYWENPSVLTPELTEKIKKIYYDGPNTRPDGGK